MIQVDYLFKRRILVAHIVWSAIHGLDIITPCRICAALRPLATEHTPTEMVTSSHVATTSMPLVETTAQTKEAGQEALLLEEATVALEEHRMTSSPE